MNIISQAVAALGDFDIRYIQNPFSEAHNLLVEEEWGRLRNKVYDEDTDTHTYCQMGAMYEVFGLNDASDRFKELCWNLGRPFCGPRKDQADAATEWGIRFLAEHKPPGIMRNIDYSKDHMSAEDIEGTGRRLIYFNDDASTTKEKVLNYLQHLAMEYERRISDEIMGEDD